MAIQTFVANTVLTAAQQNSLQANDYNQTVSAKVASYTLVAADVGTRITMSNAAATTVTVNTSLFAAGDSLRIQNIGAGACTVTAGTATVTSAGSLSIPQWGGGQLFFTSASAAVYFPDAAAVKVGQIQQGTLSTIFSTSSASYVSVGLTATITPTSASSTILVMYAGTQAAAAGIDVYTTVFRGTTAGTNLGTTNGFIKIYSAAGGTTNVGAAGMIIDSPATTSATTYTVAMKTAGATGFWSNDTTKSSITLIEVLP